MPARLLIAALVLATAATAALAEDEVLPEGIYVSDTCPSGPIDGTSIFISVGNFYGKGKDKRLKIEGGTACNISKLKRAGNVLSGKAPCESWGASGMSPGDPVQLSVTLQDPKSFTLTSKDSEFAEYQGKVWRWCR